MAEVCAGEPRAEGQQDHHCEPRPNESATRDAWRLTTIRLPRGVNDLHHGIKV